MHILILGGTRFLGRHLVEAALAAGHEVTLFNRGKSNPGLFPQVETLSGDRREHLDALKGRRWDACIDTCGYIPREVRMSAEALRDSVGHYTFISTISVYTDALKPGDDESGPLGTLDDPTVILLGCGGCMTPNWGWVQPGLAQFTRVVAYDRAGFGWSEPALTPDNSQQRVAELHSALQNAGIHPPYLLVGHSYGGLLARLYAGDYPQEVVGMVLLDPRHPDQDARWPATAQVAAASEGKMIWLLGWLARLGVLRLTDIGYQQAKDLPPAQAAQYAALWATTQFWQSIQAQGADVAELDAKARAITTLGDLPLIVISATTAWLSPGAPADETRQVYTTLNLEQATLSSNSLHRTVEGASHTSLVNQETDAQVTIEAVRQIMAALVADKPLRP